MPDQTGKQIGRYETLEEIGRGGFAVVYKARDPSLDRIVALKVLAPHLLWDASFAGRFRAEFETVTRLRHPNIVSVYEYDEVDGQPYIAMEYLPGVTLEQLLREVGEPLPLDRVLNLVQQLATALTYALRRGVVHRDVKPRNVMVGAADRVKLTDFGIAKVAARTFQTTTGRIFGSPEYMSPEQAQGEELDHRSDVYSLGVVLYEMVTGRVPFSSDTPLSVMLGHCERQPPPPSALNPDLSAPVEAVVLKALAKSRDDRFQSASELAYNLRRAVEGKSLVLETPRPVERELSPPSPTPAPVTRKPVRRFNWACLGTILGIIPALVVVFVLLRPLWEIVISYITKSTPTAQALVPTYTPSLTPTATHTPAPTDTPLPTATWTPQPTPTERVIIVERPVTVEVFVEPPPTSVPTPTPCPPGAVRVGDTCATVTPTPTPTWAPIYQALFTSEDRVISTSNLDVRRWYLENNELHGDVYAPDVTARYYPSNDAHCRTCTIEVTVRIKEEAEVYYGLVFRRVGDDYYTFEVSGNGQYRVRRHRAKGGWEDPPDWQYAAQLNTSAGQTNLLAVQCLDNLLYLYINSREVPINKDTPLTGIENVDGLAGFFVGSGKQVPVSVAFDDFMVYARP
jgi:serine/threonine protein kinase